jgi:hypothetical protein
MDGEFVVGCVANVVQMQTLFVVAKSGTDVGIYFLLLEE